MLKALLRILVAITSDFIRQAQSLRVVRSDVCCCVRVCELGRCPSLLITHVLMLDYTEYRLVSTSALSFAASL